MPDDVRPRLLVLASTFPGRPGDGTPGFVADLAAVQARTFDTLVLAPRVPGAARDERQDGYRVHRFPYFVRRFEDLAHGAILENLRTRRSRLVQVVPFLVAELLATRRAVRDFDPDVLHVHWIVPQGAVALLAARGRPRVVTTLGGDLYALTSPPWRLLKRAVLRSAGAATGMNADMGERLRRLGMPADRVHVMPMGADAGRIARAAGGEVVAHRMVFVGRLAEKKGVAVLLDAVGRIAAEVPWSLDIIGDGPLRAELERLAAPLGDRVRFLGHQPADALARLLHTCEIAVFPSVPARSGDQDGLPVAMLEAMTAGKPVVASRIAGIDEAVVDGEHGLLVPPGDAGALADALTTLLVDDQRRLALGRNAGERARLYSMEHLATRYVDLLRGLL